MTASRPRYGSMTEMLINTRDVQTTTLRIDGLACSTCIRHVMKVLDRLTGVIHVEPNPTAKEAVIEHVPGSIDAFALAGAVRVAGYRATVLSSVPDADCATAQSTIRAARPCCCSGK